MKNRLSLFLFILMVFSIFYGCTAVEEEAVSPRPTQYSLTVTASAGGRVSPEATGTYNEGTTMTLSAIPDEGYRFVRWLGSDNDNGRCGRINTPVRGYCRCIVTLYSNRDIQAFFEMDNE